MKEYCVLLLFFLQVIVDCRPLENDTAAPHVRRRRSTDPHLGDLPPPNTIGLLNEQHNFLKLLDCRCIYDANTSAESGLYTIDLCDGMEPFSVYCDMGLDPASSGDKGWTIIQRRLDDSLSFEKNWKSYKNGFGDLYGNFWLGLEKISRITAQGSYELYVGLGNHFTPQGTAYARYGSFSVDDESTNYKLSVGSYDAGSTAGDAMAVHDDQPFSTKDKDNDAKSTLPDNCAETFKGGWWYLNCHNANLNGKWYAGGTVPSNAQGINWQHWSGDQYSLKTAIMAIRSVST